MTEPILLPDGRAVRVLRSVTFTLTGTPLIGTNDLKRKHPREYAAHRRDLAQQVQVALAQQGVRTGTAAWVPWEHVTVAVALRHPGSFDADNKHGCLKALFDVLQRPHVTRNPDGLGLIHDDSDGEYGRGGCIQSSLVRQITGSWAVTVEVRQVQVHA
ncbi:hypothetical protein DM785_02425 [Deinococcus actinosclerus]|nr:hypothetical protein DM785_02425 [Deinococcus actinosclerus]